METLNLFKSLFKIDSLNIFLVPFICLFGLIVIIYSLGGGAKAIKSKAQYYIYLILTVATSCLAVLANNMLLFLAMWGFGALLLYLLIGIQDPAGSSDARKKTLVLVGGSDAVMLLGIAVLWKLTGTFNMDQMRVSITGWLSTSAFLMLVIPALTKAGAMPFHTWIPASSEVAPVPVLAILPASIDKLLGIYLLSRCSLNIFEIQRGSGLSLVLMLVGAVTIICAVMMALIQHNYRKLLAYHAVSQVGYMVLGIASATPVGIAGGLFHMLNNAIYKTCLFLTGGNAEYRTGEHELGRLGGLSSFMPISFISCLIASLSISGVPPFNGFFSKWMIYQGVIQNLSNPAGRFTVFLCLVAAMFGSALTLASFMKLLHAIFLGQMSPSIERQKPREVNFFMWSGVLLLSLLCIVFGVFANRAVLKIFIYPAVSGVSMAGNYSSVISTMLILAGILIGLVIYYASGIMRSGRRDTHFIGGEVAELENKVSGAEFYNTIKEFGPLKILYDKAEKGVFDIYEQGKTAVFGAGRFFQYLHNGVLPTYLVWILLGMIALFWRLLIR